MDSRPVVAITASASTADDTQTAAASGSTRSSYRAAALLNRDRMRAAGSVPAIESKAGTTRALDASRSRTSGISRSSSASTATRHTCSRARTTRSGRASRTATRRKSTAAADANGPNGSSGCSRSWRTIGGPSGDASPADTQPWTNDGAGDVPPDSAATETDIDGDGYTDGSAYEVLHHFSFATGNLPCAGLVQDPSGTLFGCTSQGGPTAGSVFSLDPGSRVLTRIHAFDPLVDGSNPWGVVLRDLGSTNGTYVDGVQVGETALHDGAVVNVLP